MEYKIRKDPKSIERIKKNKTNNFQLITNNKNIFIDIRNVILKYGSTLLITSDSFYSSYILVFTVTPIIKNEIMKLLNTYRYKKLTKYTEIGIEPLINASLMNRMDIKKFLLLPNIFRIF